MRIFPVSAERHVRVFFSFGAIQAMQLVIPLLAFPWLGRVLGPDAFGLLMYMCLIPPIIALFMDWGLPLGATRIAARFRGSASEISNLLGAVFSAKLILCAGCVLCATLALPLVPHASAWPKAYFMAISLGICRGISPVWFFQGIGDGMGAMAIWDVVSSLFALALIFIFIREPSAWPDYLLFTAACKGAAYLWLNFQLWRRHEPDLGLRKGIAILGFTKTLFLSSFFTVIYNNGSQLILGYFLPASQMGIIVAINKMLRALVSIVNPFTQTIFPELCILKDLSLRRARHILRYSVIGLALMTLLGAIITAFLAPWIIRVALGPQYVQGIEALRIMIFAAPLLACDYTLGNQGLVAFGQEKAQMAAQAWIAALSIPTAACFGCVWGIVGASFLPIFLESILVVFYILAIARHCPEALWNRG